MLFFTAFIPMTGVYVFITTFSCWKQGPKDGLEAPPGISGVYEGQRGASWGKPVRQADVSHGLVLSFGYFVAMQVFPHLSHVGFLDEYCPGTSRNAAVQGLF